MKTIRTILACIRIADQKYNLFNKNDKIVIGLSGGKDSVALLYALNIYSKFEHTDFTIQPVILDLGFPNFDPTPMKEFCKSLGYELIVNDSKFVYKALLNNQFEHVHLPCSICSRMKKAAINNVAKELGFNKVAFAHHSDDAIETLFMNETYGGRIATFSPKMHLKKADITFIRPLILCKEKDISSLIKEINLPTMSSNCPSDKKTKREEIKNYLSEIYQKYPFARENYLTMLDNYEQVDIWDKEICYQLDQEGLYLKPVTQIVEMNYVHHIRYEVFVKNMDISMDDEFELDKDNDASHFLIYKNDEPIGTIRYRFTDEKKIKIERFAIMPNHQNKGYGRKVLNYLISYLFQKFNPCYIYIHAMSHLKDFYQSVGLTLIDEIFYEADIPHYKLFKDFK